MKTIIYLVRHGQTLWNKSRKLQGWSDIPLTEKGKEQAKEVANRLRGHTIHAVYSSTLSRARETAEEIAKYHNLSVQTEDSFKEAGFGVFEGMSWEEISEHPLNKNRESTLSRYFEKSPGGGESIVDVELRVSKALDRIVGKHPNEHIVIVSHSIVMKSIAHYIGMIAKEDFERFYLENGTICELEYSHRIRTYSVIDFPAHWVGENKL